MLHYNLKCLWQRKKLIASYSLGTVSNPSLLARKYDSIFLRSASLLKNYEHETTHPSKLQQSKITQVTFIPVHTKNSTQIPSNALMHLNMIYLKQHSQVELN